MVTSTGRSPFRPAVWVAIVVGLVGLLALGNCPVLAQGFAGSITGTVKDVSGAGVLGATVTVKHLETGLTRAVEVDATGNYRVLSLPVGEYELTAEKMGFQREVRRGIKLVVAQEAVLNFTLQVGSMVQQVTVTEDAPLINTTPTSTSGLISEEQIKELPLNGRSFDQLLTLNPGTANSTSNTFNGNAWSMFSVAGKRPETNRFTINGIDYIGGNATGLYITPSGASGMLLGVDAVREYNVLTDTYGAEYGKRAGGQISIVTSSGTNQLHGELFEFLRNSAFDARNTFDDTVGTPPFKRHQFGGALGGPLKKDKLFLFGNYEAFRQRLAVSDTAIVPGSSARLGSLPCGAIYTTSADRNANCKTGLFAPVPVPHLNPKMLEYANAFWPAPCASANCSDLLDGTAKSFTNPPSATHEDFGLARFDYILSSKDTFSANYTNDNGLKQFPRPNAFFNQTSEIDSQTLGMQETHVSSSGIVNVATLGYARTFATFVNAPAVPIPSSLVFVPGGNPGSIIIGGGIFTVQQSTVVPADSNNLNVGARNYFTEADDLHFTKGKHSWSAGVWLQRVQNNVAGGPQGSAGNVAYKTVLDFLQDHPSQALLVRNPVMVGYRSLEAAWYVQDEIKLLPNLTMRLGLRDEMTNGWNEEAGRCTNYFYDPGFVIQTNPHIGGSCLEHNNAKALWQPRVGLAWDPTGTGSWAVRAGFGIHNDLLDNLTGRAYPNPPYQAREQLQIPAGKGFLDLLPLQRNVPLPPTCNAQLVAAKQLCSIYQPGGFDPDVHTPTIQMWNFTVERQLTMDLMLQVGYVGSQSYHTSFSVDNNMFPPEVCQDPQGCLSGGVLPASQARKVPQGTTYMPSRPPVLVGGPIGSLIQRPNPYVSNPTSWWNQGTSSYHALDVSLVKRATHGLAFKANYSFAKVIDLNSAFFQVSGGENEPADVFSPYNLALNRGPAAFSLHHQFNANFTYQLPFGSGQRFGSGANGFLDKLIGGWQWNGIVTAQGGFPLTPQIGFNNSGTGDNNITDVPNWNPDFKGPATLGTRDHWFDPKAFTMPTVGTFGNVSRGALRGPGLVDVDTSFFKRIKINERFNMQFRAEAFNILNHANYGYPNSIVFSGKSSDYLYVDTAGATTFTSTSSRQLQLALKLLF